MEGRQHEELLLQLPQVHRLHRVQHRLHRLERQILQDGGDLGEVVLDSLFAGLIHDADHDVAEDAELKEVAELDSQVEGLENVGLAEVEDEGDALETVREEGRQVVVEMIIQMLKVVLEVRCEVFEVVEYDFLKVLFNDSQDPSQLDVAHARDYVIGDRVILVTNQYGELDIQALHHLC